MSDQVPNKIYLNGTFHHVQIGLENNTGITNQNGSWQDEQQSFRYELNDLNERVGDIETELDEQPSIRDELGNLKDRVEDLETELDLVKKKNTELENDAADSRSKIDHLTKAVKKLEETSNETKEMTGGKREGPILKKKRALENVAPCSRDKKERREYIRDTSEGPIFCFDNALERFKELVNDAASSGDEIDYERLWDMMMDEIIDSEMSGYSVIDLLKWIASFFK